MAPMAQRLEGFHVGFLRHLKLLKANRLRDGSWRKVTAYKVLQGGGDTTAPDILGQNTGKSGVMGGLKDYLLCMCEGDRLRGRVEDPGAVVETGVRG